jgi:hypothetical protein
MFSWPGQEKKAGAKDVSIIKIVPRNKDIKETELRLYNN